MPKNWFHNQKQGEFQISSHLHCGEIWNSSKFGKISDFSTSVLWKSEILLHLEKFKISAHLSCIEIWNSSTWPIFYPPILRWYRWQIWSPDDHHASLWSTSRHHLPNRPQIWFLQCWQPPSGFQSFNWRFVNISFILQQDNYQFLLVLIIFSCPQTSQ